MDCQIYHLVLRRPEEFIQIFVHRPPQRSLVVTEEVQRLRLHVKPDKCPRPLKKGYSFFDAEGCDRLDDRLRVDVSIFPKLLIKGVPRRLLQRPIVGAYYVAVMEGMGVEVVYLTLRSKIGRASCRERVCQYV